MNKISRLIALVITTIVILNVLMVMGVKLIYATRTINSLRTELVELKNTLDNTQSILEANIAEYNELKNSRDRLEKEAKKREVLYERSKPILLRATEYPNSKTNYLNAEFIETVRVMSEAKNVPYQLIFAIIDVESNFHSDAKNKHSSAIGIGQITKGTGKFIHENLLHREDKYIHESLLSPQLNVQYMIEYISYLYSTRGSIDDAMKLYCGGYAKGHETFYEDYYRNKLMKALVSFNMTDAQANSILTR